MSTITAKRIDELPAAPAMQDDCVLPISQNGTAEKLTGAQLKEYAKAAAKEYAEAAKTAADRSEAAADSIANMIVEATALEVGSEATVEKSTDPTTGTLKLSFGLPRGISGVTPERGVDYWTPADQEAIIAAVMAQLVSGDEVSY